jgi:AcrR family transcriptional regulator
MILAANRGGFARASVTAVIEEAGVSRKTFYEYFEDREACFAESLQEANNQLLVAVQGAVSRAPAEAALEAAVQATVDFAVAHPAEARFLMKEALAGGPAALDVRDHGIAKAAQLVEAAGMAARPGAQSPDVPVVAVLGAVHRLLAVRLRRGEQALGELRAELTAWLASYRADVARHRWGALERLPVPERSPYLMPPPLRPPARLKPGRQRLDRQQISEHHRERIMFATARAVQEHGYPAVTVAIILKLAGLDSRAFYRLFSDRADAFTAIHEAGFQYLMSATAGAFFTGETWPDRVWEGFRAATQSIDDTPTFAHVGFVEAYAVGPLAIQRVEDSRIAFTVFLQEGYRCENASKPPPSRLAMEAIITTIFEIIYTEARASATPMAACLLGHLVHLALVPFIGVEATNDFLRVKSGGVRTKSRGAAKTARKSDLGGPAGSGGRSKSASRPKAA